MIYKSHSELAIQSVLHETKIRLEQKLSIGLKAFSERLQEKSRKELLDINLHVLEMMRKNYKTDLLFSYCRQMVKMVDKQISKLKI